MLINLLYVWKQSVCKERPRMYKRNIIKRIQGPNKIGTYEWQRMTTVSYTHLDVYKRQVPSKALLGFLPSSILITCPAQCNLCILINFETGISLYIWYSSLLYISLHEPCLLYTSMLLQLPSLLHQCFYVFCFTLLLLCVLLMFLILLFFWLKQECILLFFWLFSFTPAFLSLPFFCFSCFLWSFFFLLSFCFSLFLIMLFLCSFYFPSALFLCQESYHHTTLYFFFQLPLTLLLYKMSSVSISDPMLWRSYSILSVSYTHLDVYKRQ